MSEQRDAAAFLEHLECAPRGFGHTSAVEFAAQLQQRAADGAVLLFVLGEPLSGKSTFLSNLLRWLAAGQTLTVKVIRWGDAMRAQRHLGLLPADRVPGDLSAQEFADLSAFVGDQVFLAREAVGRAGLVVAEFPGCTAVLGPNGEIEGLDRGFSTCRTFAGDERAFYVALTAEPRLRASFLGSRETAPAQATNAREATPLAANRINQQLTELASRLREDGRLEAPAVDRDRLVFEYFLPHLLGSEIGVPGDRALVARNLLLPESQRAVAQVDPHFVDRFDYIRERYDI